MTRISTTTSESSFRPFSFFSSCRCRYGLGCNNRHERTYLWLFLIFAFPLLRIVVALDRQSAARFCRWRPTHSCWMFSLPLLTLPLWAMFWWDWFGLAGKAVDSSRRLDHCRQWKC